VVAFFPLLVGVAAYATRQSTDYSQVSVPLRSDWLAFGMAFLAFHNGASALTSVVRGEYGIGLRVFFLFFLPLGIYAIASTASAQARLQFIAIVALTSLIVALEMLYENISARIFHSTTWFQLLNKDYVFSVSGRSLSQLYLPTYRSTGLLEHVHATVLYVCLGAIASLVLYVSSGRLLYFLILLVSVAAVLQHGVRVQLVGLFVALFAAFYSMRFGLSIAGRRNLMMAFCAVFCLTVILLIADPLGIARQYYWPVLMRGDFQTTEPLAEISSRSLSTIVNNSDWGRLLSSNGEVDMLNAFFGLGIASSLAPLHSNSDDFFVLQLVSQYGLFGAAVYFGMFYVAIQRARLGLGSSGELDRFLAVFSLCALVLLGLSSLHSGVTQRKAIYPVLMLALALAAASVQRGKDRQFFSRAR